MNKKHLLAFFISFCMLMSCMVCPAFAAEFKDTQGHWASQAINQITDKGYFMGTGADTFSPDKTMTRGMFVTVLGRVAESFGVNIPQASAMTFLDTDASEYYAKYIEWANANGIVTGVDARSFAPDESVTREQMCAIFARFLKYAGINTEAYSAGTLNFTDSSDISAYAAEYVRIASSLKLIEGTSTQNGLAFNPKASATRAEVATVFMRLINMNGSLGLSTSLSGNGGTGNNSGVTPPATENTPSAITGSAVGSTTGSGVSGGSSGGGGGGGSSSGGSSSGGASGGSPSTVTEAERQAELQMIGYLQTMQTNYNNSTYLVSTEQPVKDCMNKLMTCIGDAITRHNNGQFISKEFVTSQYAAQIEEVRQMRQAMTDVQKNQMNNVIIRLETTEHLYAVLDYFGYSI